MFDKILEFGTIFDWISPLIAAVKDITNGPSHTFMMREDCGWSGRKIANILKQNGVESWGHMIVNHNIMITVRRKQARWAQYLLEREAIPIQYGLLEEKGKTRRAHSARRSRQTKKRRGMAGLLQSGFASIIDDFRL